MNMRRSELVLAVGAVVVAAGAFLTLRADSLATNWQPTTSGNGWGGVTDPVLRHTYTTVGVIGLCFGLALVAMAAWRWLAEKPGSPPPGASRESGQ
jgi:hypothetical protein